MPLQLEHQRPMVRSTTSLYHHPLWRPTHQAARESTSRQPPALDNVPLCIGEHQLEDIFCKVDRDGSSIHGDGPGWVGVHFSI